MSGFKLGYGYVKNSFSILNQSGCYFVSMYNSEATKHYSDSMQVGEKTFLAISVLICQMLNEVLLREQVR